jgi:hypothetical protein
VVFEDCESCRVSASFIGRGRQANGHGGPSMVACQVSVLWVLRSYRKCMDECIMDGAYIFFISEKMAYLFISKGKSRDLNTLRTGVVLHPFQNISISRIMK